MSRYPAVSHAFVAREIAAVRAAGVPLATLSIHRAGPGDLLAAEDRREDTRTFAVLPVSVVRLVRAHLRALARSPNRYVATLRLAFGGPKGLRNRLWQLFYFVEAMVLWEHCQQAGIRHLHAQFADVASDVAMLVAHFGAAESLEGWSWSLKVHGSTDFYNVRQYRIAEKLRRAHFALGISDFGRSQLMTMSDMERWPGIRVVRCGVDLDTYVPPASRPKPNVPEVLFVGRLIAGKGLSILIEVLAQLRDAGRPLRLAVVGEGPARERLQELVRRLDLTGAVVFHGAVGQDEIRLHYERADIFCLPSFAEGVPVVVMEAMAMELPVISSPIMGIPELVENGVTGLLVTPGRLDPLRAALERLVDSPELRIALGRAARAKIARDFDVRESGETLAEIFTEELGEQFAGDARSRTR